MRSEPPTDSRIEELRRRGIAPYSGLATAIAIAAALAGAAVFVFPPLQTIAELWSGKAGGIVPVTEELRSAVQVGRNLLMLSIVIAVAAGVAMSLLQTRFLLRWNLPARAERRRNAPSSGAKTAALLVGAALYLGALMLVVPNLLGILRGDPVRLQEAIGTLWERGRIYVFALLAITALGAVFAAHLRFRRAYRMTREEVRREAVSDD